MRSFAAVRSYAAVAVAALVIGALPLVAQTPAGPKHGPPPRPKNLQVLPKDISGRDLIHTMVGYTKALGVDCSFCHADNPQTHRLDFASDANPHKNMARTMIRMVDAINTKYLATLNGPDNSAKVEKVSCATCHRGHSEPPPFEPAGGTGPQS